MYKTNRTVDNVTGPTALCFSLYYPDQKRKHAAQPHFCAAATWRDKPCFEYPEMNTELLAIQLLLFILNYLCSGCREAAELLTGLLGEVCGLFTKVETLIYDE